MRRTRKSRRGSEFLWMLGLLLANPLYVRGQTTCHTEAMGGGAYCALRGPCDGAAVRDAWIPGTAAPLIRLRLKFIVFRNVAGVLAATQAQIDAEYALINSNQNFGSRRISFIVQPPTFVTSDASYYFCDNTTDRYPCYLANNEDLCRTRNPATGLPSETDEWHMKAPYAISPDTQINVFVVKSQSEAAGSFSGGIGALPWCPEATDRLGGVVIHGDWLGTGTLTHELGHVFGLFHTFRGVVGIPAEVRCQSVCYEPSRCDGTCAQSDCNLKGDLCCDTPSTSKYLIGDCTLNYDPEPCFPYQPYNGTDVTNFMGYGGEGCWNRFSNQQAGRMPCWICDRLRGWIDSPDCNNNATKDVCDIRAGTSRDCDANGVPDEC